MSADVLLSTWLTPSRRRARFDTLLLGLPVLLLASALVWRLAGLVPAAILLLLGAGLLGALIIRRARRFDQAWLVRRLDASRADLEDSSGLIFADPQGLGPLQRLQRARLDQRLEQGVPEELVPHWSRRAIPILWIIALLGIAALLLWPRGSDRPVVLAPASEGIAAKPGGDHWIASRTLDASFLYRVDSASGRGPLPPLHRIDGVADALPQVKLIAPAASLNMVAPGQRSWTPVFAATDDYGVAATARLRITLAIGEGENIRFTEREIAVSGSGPARDRRFAPRLDFGALGFSAGGDMVVQIIVRDNRAPSPQEVRGPSVILRWPAAKAPESGGLQGMVNTTLPAYFRSQRQIIIDAEALLKRKRSLSADKYLSQSNGIGNDQKILRGRYSQFLGGESEGEPSLPTADADGHGEGDGHDHGPPVAAPNVFGEKEDVLAEFGHPHDESPASSLDPETRAILKQAVDEMWQSEMQLKQGRPDLALPFAYKALRFIKEVQQATRIFLSRVGPELPPIDPARRMTGKREGIAGHFEPLVAVEGDDGPAAAAWRGLAQGPVSLGALEGWARANAARLPDPLALSGAIDAVRRDPGCASCRDKLRAQLWMAMERPQGGVARRRPADAAGARYLGAIGGRP
ncbi:MAG: DUF4175 domain-containing protein [Sphingobium sp.]|nr:MAG: DUF4175 domain-containing protein [Sphingobium sp.]